MAGNNLKQATLELEIADSRVAAAKEDVEITILELEETKKMLKILAAKVENNDNNLIAAEKELAIAKTKANSAANR